TTDPEAALKGSIIPLGYKGYGIAFIVEILSGTLSGGPFGPGVGELYRSERPQEVCHLFGALAIEAFIPAQVFKQRVDQLIREVRAMPKVPGVEKIYFPGEIEWEKAGARSEQGIPLSEAVYQELSRLGEECGLTLAIF
ncbi:MAG: Ldh family oxidoreductase, partial [candidate division NC10 bacterium]|nr:Ldh family oxidoreductase [candidate division NC10 bacterium]